MNPKVVLTLCWMAWDKKKNVNRIHEKFPFYKMCMYVAELLSNFMNTYLVIEAELNITDIFEVHF